MRVLIQEQQYGGHHFLYLAYILPRLLEVIDEAIVTLSPLGRESTEFATYLAPFSDRVDFQAILPAGDASLSLKSRFSMLECLRGAVERFRPDYVLVPTGDGPSSAMGLSWGAGRRGLPNGVPGEVGIHYGYGAPGIGMKNRIKDRIYLQTQRLARWNKVHYVSVLNYEWVRSQGGSLARRAELLPHPVPAHPRLAREECRRRLGLPEGGRYIGLMGLLDPRKAIPELLAAFRSAAGPEDRLILAGRLHESYARLIEAEYADLIEELRLIVLDRFLDEETSHLVFGALDVTCTPYPKFGPLSSVLLRGIAAGKPVLGNDFGWTRAMIRRFGFGWTCDIHDPIAFAGAVRRALEEGPSYRETEATRRLLEFHSPENFAECWLGGIREARGLPRSESRKTWEWVVEALDEGRRRLN